MPMPMPATPAQPERPYAVYVFTLQGWEVARKLSGRFPITLFAAESLRARLPQTPESDCPAPRHFARLSDLMPESFLRHSAHIFISATGIAVRAIAPLLQSKLLDPAVLVIDQRARFVVSLVSGHYGGANALTAEVAGLLGAVPVISTATDGEGLPALDVLAQERGLAMVNPGAVKAVSAAMLAGDKPWLHDLDNWLGLEGKDLGRFRALAGVPTEGGGTLPGAGDAPGVLVTVSPVRELPPNCLLLHPPALTAGIGCRRGVSAAVILAFIRRVFAERELSPASLCCLASLEAKRDETGLLEAAGSLGLRLILFKREELAAWPVATPSATARRTFGLDGVCEPAALAAARALGENERLLLPKVKGEGVTLAIARFR